METDALRDFALNSEKDSFLKNLVGTQISIWSDFSVLMES